MLWRVVATPLLPLLLIVLLPLVLVLLLLRHRSWSDGAPPAGGARC